MVDLSNARWTIVGLALAGAACAAQADASASGRVVRAALFKNGIAVVHREVEVTPGRKVIVEGLPPALHGTFWLRPSEGMRIERAVASPSRLTTREPAMSLLDILRANVGRSVEVQVDDGWTPARIVAVPEAPLAPGLPPTWPRPDARYGYYVPPTQGPEAGLVVLESPTGTTWALPPAAVKSVRGRDLVRDVDRGQPAVSLSVDVAGRGGVLGLDYAVHGLAWAPSYRIELGSKDAARLELRAEIVDDVEDLEDVEVSLVTGFPHLRFDDVPDPLTTTGTLEQFLQFLGLSGSGRAMQPVMTQNSMAYAEVPRRASATGGAGESVEDLYFFPVRGVTLRRGERSSHEVLSLDVPARTIHVWRVDEGEPTNDEPWRARQQAEDVKPPEVWEIVRLTNSGGVPWTTGPALTTKGGRVLGQDVLHFTPSGGSTDVRVTRAAGIRTEELEAEVSRSRVEDGRWWEVVIVDAQLLLTNARGGPVTVEVMKGPFRGEVLSSDPPARSRKLANELQSGNPRQELEWDVSLPAGTSAVLKYRYRVRVPA